ncbi:3D domain-containing protein [Selenomonas ruminantium]|uniref:3D domain-containing protein n=1 Tax=Selenomonas ruminantium TaxID=971 RepID=UPI0026F37B65|nr:3D domain-containing protein [Selenomonas ruminantium]
MFLLVLFTLTIMCFTAALAAASILVKDGSQGEAVRHVQELLIEQGFLQGDADGACGPLTVAAIKAFQKSRGLTEDGVCGDGTYYYLSGGRTYESREGEEEKPRKNNETHHETAIPSGRAIYVSASAYSAYDPGNSKHTASGTLVRRGVIAVDPDVIPLGTHVFIPGYGEAVAEDIGSSIRGHRIDVAFDTHEEALSFGRRDLEIIIID